MRTRNQAPNNPQTAIIGPLDSPESLSSDTVAQKSLQNPENSDQKSDAQDLKPLTRSTRQSTQQLQETKGPATLLKPNKSQIGPNGPALSEFRNQDAENNGEAASLHQIQETKPILDLDYSLKTIEKKKQLRPINSKPYQAQIITSLSKHNRRNQPSSSQLEASETTKTFNDFNNLKSQQILGKSNLKSNRPKRDKVTGTRKCDSTGASLVQDYSAQKQLNKKVMPYGLEKLNAPSKKIEAGNTQSQQDDIGNGSRELISADQIEIGDVQSISASQNINSKRRKGPHGLAINLQARKRIQNQQRRRQDQNSDDLRPLNKADIQEEEAEDDRAFWALFALFLKCHIKENQDVKYDSNSSLLTNEEDAKDAKTKAKTSERQVTSQNQLHSSTIDQKRRTKEKSKRQKPHDLNEEVEEPEFNKIEENEEFNSLEFYVEQIQLIENQLAQMQQILEAWNHVLQFQNVLSDPNQTIDQETQERLKKSLIQANNLLLQEGVIDQDGNCNGDIQQLNVMIMQKYQYRQQLYERYKSMETEREDVQQVHQYLTSLNDLDRQDKIYSDLQKDLNLDDDTEMLIRGRIQQMGIDVDNLILTQPNTYNLFRILYLTSGNESDIEKDEGFKNTVNNVKDRQVENVMLHQAEQQGENFVNQRQTDEQVQEEPSHRNQVMICKFILLHQQEQENQRLIIEASRQGLIQVTSSGEILLTNGQIFELDQQNQIDQARQLLQQDEGQNQQQQQHQKVSKQQNTTPDQVKNKETMINEHNSEFQIKSASKRQLLSSVQSTTNKQIEKMQELLKSDTDRKREILLSSARGGFNSARQTGPTENNQIQEAEISHFQTHFNQDERQNDDVFVQNQNLPDQR